MNENLIKTHGIDLLDLVEETSRVYVWKAVQKTLDRSVFLVILKENPSSDPVETAYFLQVAQQFAKLKSESLAAIFDIVSEDGLNYVIMEHVEGLSLDALIKQKGVLSYHDIMQVATSVTGCLKQLWNNSRIIHRNLKGSTIRFDSRGIAKLMDFSRAVIDSPDFDTEVIDKGHVTGAPSFLSPEQARGEVKLSVHSDMYALGALLYYISTGKAPFAEHDPEHILSAHISGRLTPPHLITPGLPVNFSRLVHTLMMKDQAFRYKNWEAVHHDLHCLLDGREPVCAKSDIQHASSIIPDFSEAVFKNEDQLISVKFKPKKRNKYLEGIQDKHVIHHHEADEKSRRNLQQLIWWGLLALWLVILFWFRAVIQVNPEKRQKLLDKGKQISSTLDNIIPGKERTPETVKTPEQNPKPSAKLKYSQNTPHALNTVKGEPIPADILQTLAQAFKSGDLAAAITALSSESLAFAGKDNLLSTLKKVPSSDDLVAKHLLQNLGKPLVMNFKGKPRKVVPKGVGNNIVQLEANGRSIDFSISKLTPEQKFNWIDPPQTVQEHIALCLLLLQIPQTAEAARYEAQCGPFAPVVQKAIELSK